MTPRRPNFTCRLRADLARTAALVPALRRPADVLILPSALSHLQSFVNKVHTKAGPRRR